jgi:hypothetical protein
MTQCSWSLHLIWGVESQEIKCLEDIRSAGGPVLNGNKITYYISEMRVDIKLRASSFSVVTLPLPFRLVKVVF